MDKANSQTDTASHDFLPFGIPSLYLFLEIIGIFIYFTFASWALGDLSVTWILAAFIIRGISGRAVAFLLRAIPSIERNVLRFLPYVFYSGSSRYWLDRFYFQTLERKFPFLKSEVLSSVRSIIGADGLLFVPVVYYFDNFACFALSAWLWTIYAHKSSLQSIKLFVSYLLLGIFVVPHGIINFTIGRILFAMFARLSTRLAVEDA